ncbi:hypothetical protein [Uliginosibacterium aquaticum]|uniref:Peptidoglycan binding-like domain-containing protein n=1 Tax=Uliginosibacterium aquaticum TaxID=2731212 RepID=A0ABX2IHS5_9RHOO|nr:hypothetical protein [Uliginosibacterium aquaticum]NSL56042.1 hypothetical protein [Uliginosibacterium aquaticum]
MKKHRRDILKAGVSAMVMSSISGCVTYALWDDDKYNFLENENFSSIHATEDWSKIIVLGESRHYIFDVPAELARTLNSTYYPYVFAEFGVFNIQEGGVLNGSLTIQLVGNAPEKERVKAQEDGFINFRQYFDLKGLAYDSGPSSKAMRSFQRTQGLNRTYSVGVYAEPSKTAKTLGVIGKLALTPITVAVDGSLILVTAPVSIPVLIILSKVI